MILPHRPTISLAGLAMAIVALTWLAGEQVAPAQTSKKDASKHVFTGPAPAHLVDIILARPTDRSVTVSVLAYKEMDAYLTVGPDSGRHTGKSEVRKLAPGSPTEFILKDLTPDTRYSYRLNHRMAGANEFLADAEHAFHTQRKPGSTFVFTMQADSHLDQGTRIAVYERTLANCLADKTDFHIDLGDTFMTDKYERHESAFPQYWAQRYYLGQIAHSAPLYLVLGNHDGERGDRYDGSVECMPVWSCLTRKKLFPNPFPDGFYTGNTTELKSIGRVENYYAWTWGDALFIALDPFWPTEKRGGKNDADGNWLRTLGKTQYDWLKRTLETSQARFKFVFIHHLVGGLDQMGRGGSEAAELFEWGGKNNERKDEFETRRPGWAMPIHDLLVKHGVSAVFHGHDHFYARQELDGIVYQLVPQPGHPGFDRLKNAHEYGYFRGDFQPPSGHIRVTVSPEKAVVDYVRAYLPTNETAERRNGDISLSYKILPKK